jgi:hypothetical protein
MTGCGKRETKLIERVKRIPMSGAKDTLYMERSKAWNTRQVEAPIDSNRQSITFRPLPGELAYVILQNMGGVPLRRDTVRKETTFACEEYLQTMTLDTNLRIHVEFQNYRTPTTDVSVFIRTPDSAYRQIRFEGKK